MAKEFSVNSPFLFAVVAVILLLVLTQSIVFGRRAWKRALSLGMERKTLLKVIKTSALFTIVPAISILVGVVALSKKLGLPLPWLRLSVIGAITYETPAAEAAARAVGASLSDVSVALTASQYSAIAWVMTLGILAGVVLTPILCKKLLGGVDKIERRDKKWSEIFMSALFMGMISAFLGMIFGHVTEGLKGWIPVFVMLTSALIMGLLGIGIKVLKWKWLEDYALPVSMIGAMAMAIPITNWVSGVI